MFKFIHGADLHLDSPFGGLPAPQAAERRRELRALPDRLADLVLRRKADLVLLSGDLFDSPEPYRETAERLAAALERMAVPVFIAPGNHDWYGDRSPWVRYPWPENAVVFSDAVMTTVPVPGLRATVSGAAFTGPEQRESLLRGFSLPEDGLVHLGLLHGEIGAAEARYNALDRQEIAESGLDYLALGHIHKGGMLRCGRTLCAWPGCPEGRGFDELGEKGVLEGTVSDGGGVSLEFLPLASRRYRLLEVDVTGRDPERAALEALPRRTERDICRLTLTGETGEEGVSLAGLERALAGSFSALELRDRTRVAEDVWARAGEDSLRGLFLRDMRNKLEAAADDEERAAVTRAVRFGLAALDHRDMG